MRTTTKSFRSVAAAVTLTITFLVALTATAVAGGTQQVTLSVEGMTCPGCEATVEAVLSGVDGVIEAHADRNTETASVTYDPTKTDPAAMTQAINTQTYYVASVGGPTTKAPPPATAVSAPTTAVSGSEQPSGVGLLPAVFTVVAALTLAAGGWLVRRRTPSA